MSLPICLAVSLLAVPVAAQAADSESEMQSLSDDMKAGHEAAAAPSREPAAETWTAPPNAVGHGITGEVGGGFGYTSLYANPTFRAGGLYAGSFGYFVKDDLAVLLRLAFFWSMSYRGATVDNGVLQSDTRIWYERHRLQALLAPQAQWFPTRRLMLAAGIGPTIVGAWSRVSTNQGSNSTSSTTRYPADWGVAASLRMGVVVYTHKETSAVRVGVEVLPSVIHGDWNTAVALVGEWQIY